MSRRRFLGISGLGVGAVLGVSLESAHADTPAKRAAGAATKAESANSGYHQPFALDTSSVLSEDHFLVRVGKIDPAKDKVVAYSRADGEVEAMMLEDGTISQVYRDPAASGGWSIREIAAGATDMVVGVADNKQGNPSLHVFYRAASGSVKHLIEALPGSDGISSAQFTSLDDVSWGEQVKGPLQVTNDLYRNLLVFCISPASSQSATDSKLGFHWTGWGLPGGQTQSGVLTGFGLHQSHGASRTGGSAIVSYSLSAFQGQPALLLYLPSPSGVQVYRYSPDYKTEHLSVSGTVDQFAEQPPSFAPPMASQSIVVESVDYLFSPDVNYLPTAIVRGVDQQLYALTVDYLHEKWYLQQLQLPGGAKRQPGNWDWEPSNLNLGENNLLKTNTLLNLFLVSADTLSVVRQVDLNDAAKNSVTPVYNPAMPLQDGVAGVSSQTRASAGDELIVIDAGGNLEVLTKRADGSWNANQIHLPASEPAELSTYRVQLTLSDNWGARVVGKTLQVTSSAPSIALLNGRGITLSSAPATFTTDSSGQVTIPIVADGLWAPELTVSGGGLSAPVKVTPSGSVNDYMTGTVTLNYLPAMDGGVLAGASTPAGASVFPLAGQDKDLASQAATVLAAVAAAGADPTVSGQVASASGVEGLGAIGAVRHPARTPREPVTLGSAAAPGAATFKVDGVELSFADLTNDALYAIKRGAAKVSQVAVSWDKTLNRWVSTIAADFDAWAHQVISVTIQGLEDASHVLHGVINKLGAVLAEVIDWLKAHVLALLTDTVTLAARYDGWLLQLSDELYSLTQKAKGGADRWLGDQEAEIRNALDKLKAQLGSRSISAFAESSTFSAEASAASPAPAPQEPTSAGANWLLQKVTQPGAMRGATPAVDDTLRTLLDDVSHSIDAVGQDFIDATNKFRDSLAGMVSNPRDFGSVAVGKVIDAIGDLIAAGLRAAGGVIDAVLDLAAVAVAAFKAVLQTPLDGLPLIGPLLKAAGMTKSLTIGGLVTLLVAFPTALGYKLAHLDAGALPFKNVNTSSALRAAEAADDGLSYATFAATSFWALIDTIAATIASGDDEPPALFGWIDIVAPAVISALTVPAHDDGLPFSSVIELDDKGDVYTAVAWANGAAPGVLSAIAYYVGVRYGEESGAAASSSCLYLTSLSGLFGAVFGVIAALDTSSTVADAVDPAVLAVLGNAAAMLAWGLDKQVVSGSEGVSALLAGVIGGICTFVASAMDSFGVN